MYRPVLAATTTQPVEAAQVAPLPVKVISIDDLITEYAAKYHVNREDLYNTIKCESNFDITAVGDNGLAIGLSQIRTDYHSDISVASSTDPVFAIDYMAKEFSLGHASEWSCYSLIK